MSIQWLTVQSFQQSQALLDAINTVSIFIKLQSVQLSNDQLNEDIEQARELITSFLTALETLLVQIEQGEESPVLGVDPRLRQLARKFLISKNNRRSVNSVLYHETFDHIKQLLNSSAPADREALLYCLRELRLLIEEHVQIDTHRLLGAF